jgi:N-acetylglucosaminyl-diphospho-decaprenol L-rhamnosyltransferase
MTQHTFDGRVSVVVITRDRVGELLRTLGRLAALPERPHVIVVDNASTDGTRSAVRERFPDVEVIALPANRGAAGRNQGVLASTAPYVAFSDDDSWWEPGALGRAADLLDEHPRLALVNAHILVGEERRDDPACEEMARSPLPRRDGQPGRPLLGFVACGAIVRRNAFLGVGGFAPWAGIGGEEEILSHDLAADGWTLSYVPGVVAHHHPSRSRSIAERRAAAVRNELWTAWLRRPVPAALWITARAAWRARSDRAAARGLAEAAAGVRWVPGARRRDPPHVEAMRRALDGVNARRA